MEQRSQSRQVKQPVQRLRLKLLILAGLCAMPLFGALSLLVRHVSFIAACFYVGMSVLTFFLYWRDKHQARNEGWRTPEKVLHATELLGGWPGALVAQQAFRHKTRKLSYQLVFWLIVLLHELYWIDRLLMGGRFLARHLY
ncbi:MAG: transrane protein [Pseudomonas sp.]|nr:transrane protein [Pseudomonas sp.]